MAGLLPGIAPPEKAPRHAWYKERLHTKYLKEKNNKQRLSGALDSRRWRFLKPGLDDFRDGYPLPVGEYIFTQTKEGTSPTVPGIPGHVGGTEQKPRKQLTKEQVCFSRKNPQQQLRRKHVAEVEYSLTQHPFALYPHLHECVSPELFDQILSLLDPEMSMDRDTAWFPISTDEEHAHDCPEHCENSFHDLAESGEGRDTVPSPNVMQVDLQKTDDSRPKNPYLRLLTRENSAKEDQASKVKRVQSPSLEDEIKRVTKKLHDWVVSLGDESDDLSESTLANLFLSAFERKPSLTFPIRLVDPSSVPEELYSSAEDLHKVASPDTLLKGPGTMKRHSIKAKINYGAWSREPKTSRKRITDESVQDPTTTNKDQEFSAVVSKQDEELKQSYAAQAFKKFIISKGLREPAHTHLIAGIGYSSPQRDSDETVTTRSESE
ncbi:protein FAM47E [Megalops cyprinoides]|uniref:protein FAM47E n=1 Tax=Megalops cyprinoides TaxID=118141 RepID=UPI001863B647|nr:protein FAM47E [Megalops cyprinoides]